MKVEAKIQRWGNGLALRISGVMRDIPHFEEGMKVDVDINENGFSVKKQKKKKQKLLPFKEAQLLAGLTETSAHADLLAQPLAGEIDLDD